MVDSADAVVDVDLGDACDDPLHPASVIPTSDRASSDLLITIEVSYQTPSPGGLVTYAYSTGRSVVPSPCNLGERGRTRAEPANSAPNSVPSRSGDNA